jgi:hypothetical protein
MLERLPQMPAGGLTTEQLIEQLSYRGRYFTDPRDQWIFDAIADRLTSLEEHLSSPWNVPLGVLVRPDHDEPDATPAQGRVG